MNDEKNRKSGNNENKMKKLIQTESRAFFAFI